MECLDDNLLLELADGTATPQTLAQVDQHLDGCATCRHAVADVMRAGAETLAAGGLSSSGDYASLQRVDPAHYELDRELARGGMGRIRLARDRRLGRVVALKEMLPGAGDARRFEREARITARLQHPSIVHVYEAGCWPSGEPFYAMTYVSGRSLEVVVSEAKTSAARLALVPNVLAVADAMASAHAAGIIHRDLKPTNVLVGRYGETVVIDWGLAKDLKDTVEEVAPSGESAARASAETAVGTVVGTPAYMSPEQAQGLVVDARADVYALGALLAQVLSGQAPYGGSSATETLEAVRRGPPVPLSQREPEVAPELLTIVERAMARDPAVRYPSARELADDLRRFQTGQLVGSHRYSLRQLVGRWVRRHRAAVSVAAVAGVVLVGFGAVALQRVIAAQRFAELQRTRAESSRGDAEELLGFMLVDLRDKLSPLGRLDLLDAVAKKAVTYYGRTEENLGAAELAKQALARRNLGDVLFAQGNTAAAVVEYRAALASNSRMVAQDPTHTDWQRDLAEAHDSLGVAILAQAQAAQALTEYRSALVIREGLLQRDRTNADWQRALAVSRRNIGDVLVIQGDLPAALVEYKAARRVREALVARDPTNADALSGLANLDNCIGDVLFFSLGDSLGSLAEFRASQAIRQALAQRDPADTALQRNLSVSEDRIGDVLLAQGDFAGALARYNVSLAIAQKLTASDPTNAIWANDLAVSFDNVGAVLSARGDHAGALVALRRGLDIKTVLASRDPTNTKRQRNVAVSHGNVGDELAELGDLPGARTEYQAALSIDESLAAKDPTNTSAQRDLSIALSGLGVTALALGDSVTALDLAGRVLAIDEAFAAKDPASAQAQRDLSVSLQEMGNVLRARGDLGGALERYRASLSIRERLAEQDPTSAPRELEVAYSHTRVAEVLLTRGDAAGALSEFKAALAIWELRGAREAQEDLAVVRERVGDALMAQHHQSSALVQYQAALVIRRAIAAAGPGGQKPAQAVTQLVRKIGSASPRATSPGR